MSSFASKAVTGLVVVALATSCTYSKKEDVIVEIDGPIRARAVRVDKRKLDIEAAGHGGVGILYPTAKKESDCELRIEKPTKATVVIEERCREGLQLVSDPEGKRIAYGPKSGPFNVIFLGGKDRVFTSFALPSYPAVDWAKIPTLEAALPDLFQGWIKVESGQSVYMEDEWRKRTQPLVDEIRERGDAAMVRVLVATAGAPAEHEAKTLVEEDKETLWPHSFGALGPAPRNEVLAALEKRLVALDLASEDGKNGVLRATLHADVDRDDLRAAWAPPLARAIAGRTQEPDWVVDRSIGFLLARLSTRDRAAGAKLGCALLGTVPFDPNKRPLAWPDRDDAGIAIGAIALANAKCPLAIAMEEALERGDPSSCVTTEWYCPPEDAKAPCTNVEARAYLDGVLGAPLPEARKRLLGLTEAIPVASLVTGPSAKRKKQLARHFYRVDQADEATYCFLEVEAGVDAAAEHCRPDQRIPYELHCSVEPTATDGEIVVHFDDKNKSIFVTRAPH